MRPVTLLPLLVVICASGCDDRERIEKLQKMGESSSAAAPAPPPRAPVAEAGVGSSTPMPERPVPKTSPTVGSNMPAETQMKAIAYMAAMEQPHYDDPFVDTDYVKQLVEQLKPALAAVDTGSAAEKARLDKVDVLGGGRRIDLDLAGGCEAETPKKATVGRANLSLDTLHQHGILVVACHDARVQCLQSTRDATDVLCTTAPRH